MICIVLVFFYAWAAAFCDETKQSTDSGNCAKDNPTTWFILQQIHSFGSKIDKLQEAAHQREKQLDSLGLLPNRGLVDTALENRVLKLEKEIATLKTKDKSIAFFAFLVNDLAGPATGDKVIFKGVDTNVGNAYDHVHGVFVAPVSGTYHFTLVASVHPSAADRV